MICGDSYAIILPPGSSGTPLISWTPSPSQANTNVAFEVATVPDYCGNQVTQSWSVHVSPAPVFSVGVTVSGLSGNVVLQNNGNDSLLVSTNGSFTFGTPVASGGPYSVTVTSQPSGETCSILGGTGTMAGANVSVPVTCSANTYTVGGTILGLAGVVVLQNDGGDNLTLSADGGFTFANALVDAYSYNVTVLTQPAGQVCTVANGTGVIAGRGTTNVSISCASLYPDSSLAVFAGGGLDSAPGTAGSLDGTGPEARFDFPLGVVADSAGNVYVVDAGNETVRKITPEGVVTTVAGAVGVQGNADGTGEAARFSNPSGVATDGSGNIYVADTNNFAVRKITPAGVVSTFAGGRYGSVDGTGAAASFGNLMGVATDSVGNVYVADTTNYTIRKITPAGVVSTLAGTAGFRGSADGTGAAAQFNFPWGIAADSAGNVYVADGNDNTIRKITPAGVVSTFAGTAGAAGSTDGTGAAARFSQPWGVATDSEGNVYVADSTNYAIRKVTPAGNVSTIVGVPGRAGFMPGALPGLLDPIGLAVSGTSLYVTAGNGVAVVLNRP
jgi:NHL repeat